MMPPGQIVQKKSFRKEQSDLCRILDQYHLASKWEHSKESCIRFSEREPIKKNRLKPGIEILGHRISLSQQ